MKCPHCDKAFTGPKMYTPTTAGFGTTWHTCVFCCPLCDATLSVQIDPIAIKTDLKNDLLKELRSGR